VAAIPFIIGTSFIVAAAAVPAPTEALVGALVIFMSVASYSTKRGHSERVAAPFLRFWPLVFVLAGFVLMKREATSRATGRARRRSACRRRAGATLKRVPHTDVEREILRRVRTARGPGGAAIAGARAQGALRAFLLGRYLRARGDTLILDPSEYVAGARAPRDSVQ